MSKFPRSFAESTLNRMKKKLNLPEEKIKLLYDYFEAFSNFYQLLSLKDAYKIINSFDPSLVTKDEFIAFSEILRHEKHFYFILGKEELYRNAPISEPMEREIVHESLVIVDRDYYYEMADGTVGKPLYVPSKNQLLNYADEYYYERTKYTDAVKKFLVSNRIVDAETAGETVEAIICIIRTSKNGISSVLRNMSDLRINMSMHQCERFVPLCAELHNNTRMPFNRGFTPVELSHSSIGFRDTETNFTPCADTASSYSAFPKARAGQAADHKKTSNTSTKSAKIGRNDACPCGSGKKYKKCCGK